MIGPILKWKIGDVTVTRVVEFESPVPYGEGTSFIRDAKPDALREMPWLYPNFVTEDGALNLSVHALLVDAPGMKLIVDTCVGNDKPRGMTLGRPLHRPFLMDIAQVGFPREKVDVVVCTHLHVDHVGWNTMLDGDKWVPTFPNAKYLIGRQEYEFWRSHKDDQEQEAVLADSVKPIFDAGVAEMVELNHRISPEIRLMPTTGHTPGHVSVVIESKGETAIITGDMMHHPCQIGRPHWVAVFDADQKAALATRQAMLKDWADKKILIIGTHFVGPTAGYIKRDGATYRFDT
jgi:glyoxylase-like metal-dependent hydrolase (beta-lactamase superfamily II)